MKSVPGAPGDLEGSLDVRIISGRPFVFVESVQIGQDYVVPTLFKVDLEDDQAQIVVRGDKDTNDWLVDQSGAPVAMTEFDPETRWWALKVRRGGDWSIVMTRTAPLGGPAIMGLGRDGRSILMTDNDSREEQDGLHELEPEAKDWGPLFGAGEDEDYIFDPLTRALLGVHAVVGNDDRYMFFDKDDQARWDGTAKAFPGDRLLLQSLSADHKRMVVLDDSPTEGPAYYLVDIDAKSATPIGAEYASVGRGDVAPTQPIAFRAADGLNLSGYLTLPLGKAAKALPLIVFPHGGPAARDEPGFDWWVQAIASQGYAVLQVNFRGSDGFGWTFQQKGFGQWGRKMQTDLSDGVRFLAAQGTIDPQRVCIVGASYGGYAAMAGVTLDPGVYRCAVAVSGISDVRRFIDWSEGPWSPWGGRLSDPTVQRYWDQYMGVTRQTDPVLAQISPIDHVNAIQAPLLLIHGRDDATVPFEQSQLMADALNAPASRSTSSSSSTRTTT